MIWLVSDLHGGKDLDGLHKYLSIAGADDWLIILGDLELNFTDTSENKKFSDDFKSLTGNIAFIDGNHENFDYLNALPEEEWHGGKIHRISPNILHLMRGYVFEIEGRHFFTMGGCESSQKWKDSGLWWPQERPTAAEIERAKEQLVQKSYRVDYILTHKYCKETADVDSPTLEGLQRFIEENVTYRHWYSGHWHKNMRVDAEHTIVFNELVKIAE